MSKEKANPILEGTKAPSQKVYHYNPHFQEKQISSAYKEIDTDLARDNMDNDIPYADLEDL